MTPTLPPAVEARLTHELNAWLCTSRADGSPHVTPVWFVYDDGTWWISCDGRSVKIRNVVTDPRVSLALEDGAAPVVAEGRAHVHRTGFPSRIVASFADKYDGWDIQDQPQPDAERVLLEVPVRRWLLTGTAQ